MPPIRSILSGTAHTEIFDAFKNHPLKNNALKTQKITHKTRFAARGVEIRTTSACVVALLATGIYALTSPTSAWAQSIQAAPDGTGTLVTPNGNTFNINGGSLSGDGANLFHSFQRFGLTQGQIANFLANPAIRNILGRIVGGDPSLIDGLVRVTGSNANLFLINPAGIIFGPNARLDVAGDFTATTATRLGFESDRWFNAFGSNDYASLVGTPSFFMFDAAQAGSIINAGQLSLQPGKTLLLLGGSVINVGQLSAPNGNILVAAVPGTGRVRISRPGGLLSLEVETTNASGQTIPITPLDLPKLLTVGAAGLDTGVIATAENTVQLANSSVQIPTAPGTTVVSGQVSVVGQQLGLLAGQGGRSQIDVLGDRVALLNANLDASGINGGGTIRIGGDYQGKGTVPNAKQTFISADSFIRADAIPPAPLDKGGAIGGGIGNGGRVIVWADEITRFHGLISARGGTEAGDGGFVEVSGKENLQFWGDVNTTATNGATGTLLLDPTTIVIAAGGPTMGFSGQVFAGDPGPVTIFQNQLQNLPAGTDIQIQATESITFDPAIGILTFAPGAGNITFQVGNLQPNGAVLGGIFLMNSSNEINTNGRNLTIQSGSLTAGGIESRGGTIELVTDRISLNGGPGLIRSTNQRSPRIVLRSNTPNEQLNLEDNGGIPKNEAFLDIHAQDLTAIKQDDFNELVVNGGNVNLTREFSGDPPVQFGTTLVLEGNTVNINQTVQTVGGGLQLPKDLVVNSPVLSLSANLTVAGNVRFAGDLTIQNSVINAGGEISVGGNIRTNGSDLSFISNGSIQTGLIDSSNTAGNAGNVTLSSRRGDVQVTAINAEGGPNGAGGIVDISGRFVRATGTSPGTNTSISTTGGQGSGSQTIRHDGGKERVPFTVGQPNPQNGTVGALVSSPTNQIRQGTFPETYQQGNIQLITQDQVDPTPIPKPPRGNCPPDCGNPPPFRDPKSDPFRDPNPEPELSPIERIDEPYTREFETYIGIKGTRIKTLTEAQGELQAVENATGVRTALVYVLFEPNPSDLWKLNSNRSFSELKDTLKKEIPWNAELQIWVVTSKGVITRQRVLDEKTGKPVTYSRVQGSANGLYRTLTAPEIEDSDTSYLLPAKNLYKWLVYPIQKELEKEEVHHLAFLMPRGLRAIPLAAMNDGTCDSKNTPCDKTKTGFVIDRYSVGIMPSFSLVDARYKNLAGKRMWAMGANEFSYGEPDDRPAPLPATFETKLLVTDLWPKAFKEGTDTGLQREDDLLKTSQNRVFDLGVFERLKDLKSQDFPSPFSVASPAPLLVANSSNKITAQTKNEEITPSTVLTEKADPCGKCPSLKEAKQFQTLVDGQFNSDCLKPLCRGKVGVIHMVTHAKFTADNPDESYIYFGNEKLSLSKLRELRLDSPPPPPVELLVLSACQTGVGDGEAELGFAGAAVQSRVKSVMASLWSIYYEDAFVMSVGFYNQLGKKKTEDGKRRITKSEALRQTQLNMAKGLTQIKDAENVKDPSHPYKLILPGEEPIPLTTDFNDDPLKHPKHWAGLTIIGNPW